MKHHATSLIFFILSVACGHADPDPGAQVPVQDRASEPVNISDGDALAAPAQAADSGFDSSAPGSIPGSSANAESIVPPVKVTGTWLTAEVLLASETEVQIALSGFVDGERLAEQEASYVGMWTHDQSTDPGVTVQIEPALTATHDKLLRLNGESLKAIRAQLELIKVTLVVTDRTASKREQRSSQILLEAVGAKGLIQLDAAAGQATPDAPPAPAQDTPSSPEQAAPAATGEANPPDEAATGLEELPPSKGIPSKGTP